MTQTSYEPTSPDPRTNRILAELPPDDYKALLSRGRIVSLKLKKRIGRQGAPIDTVLFPLTCMISMLAGTSEKDMVETATIGSEGVVGAAEMLQNRAAMGFYVVQLPGFAMQIGGEAFLECLSASAALKRLLDRHSYSLMHQVLLGAACNRLHSMEERCARWLLMTQDRAGADTFPLTQEFLSNMLAVRRATVNVATGMLKKAGFIRYVRGQMMVLDRQGLESASCECYKAVCRAYQYPAMVASD